MTRAEYLARRAAAGEPSSLLTFFRFFEPAVTEVTETHTYLHGQPGYIVGVRLCSMFWGQEALNLEAAALLVLLDLLESTHRVEARLRKPLRDMTPEEAVNRGSLLPTVSWVRAVPREADHGGVMAAACGVHRSAVFPGRVAMVSLPTLASPVRVFGVGDYYASERVAGTCAVLQALEAQGILSLNLKYKQGWI